MIQARGGIRGGGSRVKMIQARTLEDVDEALGDIGVDAFDAGVVMGV